MGWLTASQSARTTFAHVDDLLALATRYEQAREIVDAGHGPKTPPAAA